MPASEYNFNIEQGTSFKLQLIYRDDKNVPIDITNWSAKLIWKTNHSITQVFTTENLDYSVYKFTLDGPKGQLTLLFPASTTNGFNFNHAYYDLELLSDTDFYDQGGKYAVRLLYGMVSLLKRKSKTEILLDSTL